MLNFKTLKGLYHQVPKIRLKSYIISIISFLVKDLSKRTKLILISNMWPNFFYFYHTCTLRLEEPWDHKVVPVLLYKFDMLLLTRAWSFLFRVFFKIFFYPKYNGSFLFWTFLLKQFTNFPRRPSPGLIFI